ncbi:MAG: TetR/AcrR family transcriptional regulator [Solirubrobacterales bacterium]
MARKSREEAERTKQSITDAAFDLGAVGGLEALSIGMLADHLGLSKSGVAGHFESKEELQLAAVSRAMDDFVANVWVPNADFKAGDRRLYAVMQSWLAYSQSRHDFGGCFITAASIEFDDRPGPVRDRLREGWRNWMNLMAADAKVAGRNGAQTVFRLHALVTEAMWMNQLFEDDRGWAIARAEVEAFFAKS